MRRILAGVLLGALLAPAVAACSAAGPPGTRQDGEGGSGDAGEPAVSADESARVLRDWTKRYNAAVRSGDAKRWREAVTGPLAAPVEARVRTYGRLPASSEVSLRNPVFYVPRQRGYPHWFAAAALQDSGGREQQVLGLFVKASAKDSWRAAHLMPFRGRPPELAYDAEGYAVPAVDRDVAEAHAAWLGGDDTAELTPDAFTSGARAARQGDWRVAKSRFAAGPGPAYALQTKDGGSLVWYGLTQEQTLSGGTRGTLHADLRAYLAKASGADSGEVRATWQWLVIGYSPPSGRANVLGESLSLTSAR